MSTSVRLGIHGSSKVFRKSASQTEILRQHPARSGHQKARISRLRKVLRCFIPALRRGYPSWRLRYLALRRTRGRAFHRDPEKLVAGERGERLRLAGVVPAAVDGRRPKVEAFASALDFAAVRVQSRARAEDHWQPQAFFWIRQILLHVPPLEHFDLM
jgi:hypothetical protein